jgi:anti-sigma regulatory factor (Ser/Thr protein kinase)
MLLKVRNDIQEIDRICNDIKEFCFSNDINEKKCFDILMIVDELATNVIKYAFQDDQEHVFDILLEKNSQTVHIQLTDDGIPFDPLKKSDPDTMSSLEDRNIGGLGIFFAKQLSKLITYARIEDKNQLDILVSLKEEE